jgi:replicative DNA helicase
MSDMLNTMLDDIDHVREGGRVATCPTGFRDLDFLLGGGFWRGDAVTVAGRPGMGKTAFLLQVAANAARVGVRVGIHSLEMDHGALIRRMAAAETGINSMKLRTGQLNDAEYRRVLDAAGVLGKLPIWVNDEPMQTPAAIYAQARRWQMRHGLDLIVLDYIQILHSLAKFKAGQRQEEVSWFMRSIKAIARKLGVPILLAAQLSRACEARQDKRPMLSDLRESGSIEQESDTVMFLYRDVYYNPETENPNLLEVIVGKQRNGPTDTIHLIYNSAEQRISNQRKNDDLH